MLAWVLRVHQGWRAGVLVSLFASPVFQSWWGRWEAELLSPEDCSSTLDFNSTHCSTGSRLSVSMPGQAKSPIVSPGWKAYWCILSQGFCNTPAGGPQEGGRCYVFPHLQHYIFVALQSAAALIVLQILCMSRDRYYPGANTVDIRAVSQLNWALQ